MEENNKRDKDLEVVGIEGSIERLIPYVGLMRHPLSRDPVWACMAMPTDKVETDWPNFPAAAKPTSGRVANGQGLTEAECVTSCLGEFAELASCCDWGDEAIVPATQRQLGSQALAAAACPGLSAVQYAERDTWNHDWRAVDWRPPLPDIEKPLDWLQFDDLISGACTFIPADVALIGRREAGDEAALMISDSNGCACGPDIDSAALAAILELIERDALGRWWYGRRSRPLVDLTNIDGDGALFDHLRQRDRSTQIIDITTDLGIPTFVAVSCEPDGRDVVHGHAAGFDSEATVQSAMLEMLQMEISLEVARVVGEAAGVWHVWRGAVDMAVAPLSSGGPPAEPTRFPQPITTAADGIAHCVDACRSAGVSLSLIDRTRPEIGVPAVRAVSTDLCHYKPRFARSRLLAPDTRDLDRPDDAHMKPNPHLLLV